MPRKLPLLSFHHLFIISFLLGAFSSLPVSAETNHSTNPNVVPVVKNTASLLGTDANLNGIRDDIDTYIAKIDASEKEKNTIEQHARVLQQILGTDLTDDKQVHSSIKHINYAISCLSGQYSRFHGVITTLRKLTFNTQARASQFIEFNKLLSRLTISSSDNVNCNQEQNVQ